MVPLKPSSVARGLDVSIGRSGLTSAVLATVEEAMTNSMKRTNPRYLAYQPKSVIGDHPNRTSPVSVACRLAHDYSYAKSGYCNNEQDSLLAAAARLHSMC